MRLPSKEYQEFLHKLLHRPPAPPQTPVEARAGFEKMMEGYKPPSDVSFVYFAIDDVPACFATPPVHNDKLLLFFHGGGFTAGSIASHLSLIGKLAKLCTSKVLAIDYHLAPEFPFPRACHDALISYHYALGSYPAERIFLTGISSGAGLALGLFLSIKKEKGPLPKGCICMSPWVDLSLRGASLESNAGKDFLTYARLEGARNMYLGKENPKNPFASPVFGDLKGLAHLLIQVGDQEILLDDAKSLERHAKIAHVQTKLEVFPGTVHSWQLFTPKIPEADAAIEKIAAYLAPL